MRLVIASTAGESLIKFRGHLIGEWVRRGCEVWCISIEPKEDIEKSITALGAHYYQVEGNRTGTSVLDGLRMISKYKKAFNDIKPDACFLYMSKPIAFGGIAAIQCNIKEMYVFQTGLEIAFYSTGIHNSIIRCVLKILYRYVHAHCKTVFFMCHEDEKKMLSWKLVSQNQAYYVDGSGVDMKKFTRQDLPEGPVVLMVARLVWSKGIREYVEAAKLVKLKYPNVRFLLVGGLDENSEALSKAELNNLTKAGIIEYKGYQNDVRPFLKECSIFTLPSYHEGKGTAILEAQAVGRPIVTTDAPGCSETVIDGYNGFIVPAHSGVELAKKIEMLVKDSTLRETMANNAYEHCKKTFAAEIISNNICNRMGILDIE
jgi:glycosyltransferase involved in cell wall biosynthesis